MPRYSTKLIGDVKNILMISNASFMEVTLPIPQTVIKVNFLGIWGISVILKKIMVWTPGFPHAVLRIVCTLLYFKLRSI